MVLRCSILLHCVDFASGKLYPSTATSVGVSSSFYETI
jgi:hypothetical protein